MKIDEQKRETTECGNRDIMCTIVSIFLFSNHLMTYDLMDVLNTIMFYTFNY